MGHQKKVLLVDVIEKLKTINDEKERKGKNFKINRVKVKFLFNYFRKSDH